MRHLKKSLVPYGIGDGAIWYYGEDLMLLDNRRDASEIGVRRAGPGEPDRDGQGMA